MIKTFRKIISLICVSSMLVVTGLAVIPASAADRQNLKAAWYEPDVIDDGFAAGTLTVRTAGWYDFSVLPTDAIAYWANGNGPLEGYASMARFSITAISTSYRFPELQIIPEGADRIRVYTAPKNEDVSLSGVYVDAMLGDTATFEIKGKPKHTFAVVSDTHVVNDDNNVWTKRFKNMLTDVSGMSEVEGIFINGDMVNTASGSSTTPDKAQAEYAKIQQIKQAVCPDMPIYMSIGNHDLWPVGFNDTSLQTMEQMFCQNAVLPDGSHPDSFFYDFWIDNNHFVFVGDSGRDPNYLYLDENALSWLDTTIAAGYKDGNNTFIFMHQAMPDTVAGSITDFGQLDAHVENAYEIRQILKKYPDAVMFSSHSHYSLDSVGNAFSEDQNYPTVFNTASVANPYSVRKASTFEGSEGYIMEIYDDFILLRGRDFLNGLWLPSSQYVISLADADDPNGSGNANGNGNTNNDNNNNGNSNSNTNGNENTNNNNNSNTNGNENTNNNTNTGTNTNTNTNVDNKQTEATSNKDEAKTDAAEQTIGGDSSNESGCGSVIGVGSVALTTLIAGACIMKKKKEE